MLSILIWSTHIKSLILLSLIIAYLMSNNREVKFMQGFKTVAYKPTFQTQVFGN